MSYKISFTYLLPKFIIFVMHVKGPRITLNMAMGSNVVVNKVLVHNPCILNINSLQSVSGTRYSILRKIVTYRILEIYLDQAKQ